MTTPRQLSSDREAVQPMVSEVRDDLEIISKCRDTTSRMFTTPPPMTDDGLLHIGQHILTPPVQRLLIRHSVTKLGRVCPCVRVTDSPRHLPEPRSGSGPDSRPAESPQGNSFIGITSSFNEEVSDDLVPPPPTPPTPADPYPPQPYVLINELQMKKNWLEKTRVARCAERKHTAPEFVEHLANPSPGPPGARGPGSQARPSVASPV
ncbi:unnamed protein product [Danaus chrysippus]|uniref:(African queen) hypothetical protein n=1 Tax=Danaus chrysippus TaxID=151541 RepID=A0A8J2VU39_9NEOP|nr:unnamed protein product [Danaus chrysippus]